MVYRQVVRMVATFAALSFATGDAFGIAEAQEPVDRAMIARLRAEGEQRSQVRETYRVLTDVIGPRLTGTPGFKHAVDWTRDKLTEWGMANVSVEAFPFGRGWTLEKLTLEMTEPRYSPLVGYPEAWTPSTRGVVSGTPVYVGDKTADEIRALGATLRGAIVLPQPPQEGFITADRPQPGDTEERVRIGAPPTLRSEPKVPLRELMPLLQQLGAGLVMRPNQGQHGTIFVLGSYRTRDDAVPSVVLATEHYNMIARLVQHGSPVKVNAEVRARYHAADTSGYNVIAEIPGEDPVLRNEVVFLGAHLDSWHSATGATDNADAVSAAMEAMRLLKAVGARPRRTIRLALWGGEEQGLLGSRAYVAKHLEGAANAAARDRISVYLNDDPGLGATYGVYTEENAAAKAIFDAWLGALGDLGVKRNPVDKIRNTDHLAFTAVGIPAFTTLKDYRDYDVRTHHTNTDFFERVSERDLQQSAIVLAVFAWHAAMREGTFPRAVTQ
ncbi:MAG TPA: M20/M25/M40 family metallo-hydrolase [Gemmatimonadaceae bacterium]|nr:M20/M25/M40 family metallo-hydrolase [Gemmatimonadaceae bacterium]